MISNPLYEKLIEHVSHDLRVYDYVSASNQAYICIECQTCCKVLQLIDSELYES